jgi:hypothetical protein
MDPLVSTDGGHVWTAFKTGLIRASSLIAGWHFDARHDLALFWDEAERMTLLEETSNRGATWVERFRWVLSPNASLPVVHATPVPTPTPAPTAARSTTYLTWSALPMPRADVLPSDVTTSSAGIIAVAGTGNRCCGGEPPPFDPRAHAWVWRYSDRAGWVLVPNQPALALGDMRSVTASTELIVAVGVRNLESKTHPGTIAPAPATWTSRDGVSWQVHTQVPAFAKVTASPFGLATVTAKGPEIWSSADGATWRRIVESSMLGTRAVSALRYTSAGLVAIGYGVSWQSIDGKSWQRSPDQDSLVGSSMEDLGSKGSIIEAVGTIEPDGRPAAWRSEDGLHWTRSPDAALRIGYGDIRVVIGVPSGFLAAGVIDDGAGRFVASQWTSPDGLSWAVVPPGEPGPAGDQLGIIDWVDAGEGRVLSVGYNADGLPASWLATP